jgi:putative phage-type endonuclease
VKSHIYETPIQPESNLILRQALILLVVTHTKLSAKILAAPWYLAYDYVSVVTSHQTNAAMQHGTETEPLARAAYEARHDVLVDEVGFVPHPSIIMAGASPDGLVGDDGLIEIKCPNTATHIETLLSESVPNKYYTQMQFQIACTGRKWCDFVSFDNRLPTELQMFVKRVPRDEMYIKLIEDVVLEEKKQAEKPKVTKKTKEVAN